jgi:hypothetical protein
MENQLAVFEQQPIRRVEHEGEIWFSIYDIIQILTNTTNPKRYWNDLKKRDPELDKKGGTQISSPLKMQAAGGKQSVMCANTEGVKNQSANLTQARGCFEQNLPIDSSSGRRCGACRQCFSSRPHFECLMRRLRLILPHFDDKRGANRVENKSACPRCKAWFRPKLGCANSLLGSLPKAKWVVRR